mmetsp:Transcript_22060/g.41050  ORF Transcript_22060/g.41050 Transcript_22060/m.41050 type:complete len:168 (+) Transcript_22060:163-666(+)
MVAGKVLVHHYCYGPLSRRLEAIRTTWSLYHLWHLRHLLMSVGIGLDWRFKRRVETPEMAYLPLCVVEVRVLLGTRDSWAEGEVLRRVGRIFTDGFKQEEGVGAVFVAVDGQGRMLATGLFRLPPWATIFQAEVVAQRAALEYWCQEFQQEGVGSLLWTHALCCPMC